MNIRTIAKCDMDDVVQIEDESFEMPWGEREIATLLRERNTVGLVAEDRERYVHGFVIYRQGNSAIKILNMAVRPESRGRGVGRFMLRRLVRKCGPHSTWRVVTVNIVDNNLDAHLFFRSCGARATGICKNSVLVGDEVRDTYRFVVTPKGFAAVDVQVEEEGFV